MGPNQPAGGVAAHVKACWHCGFEQSGALALQGPSSPASPASPTLDPPSPASFASPATPPSPVSPGPALPSPPSLASADSLASSEASSASLSAGTPTSPVLVALSPAEEPSAGPSPGHVAVSVQSADPQPTSAVDSAAPARSAGRTTRRCPLKSPPPPETHPRRARGRCSPGALVGSHRGAATRATRPPRLPPARRLRRRAPWRCSCPGAAR